MPYLAKKLLPYIWPYRWRFSWALAQVFLIAGFNLLKPWPLQLVIDDVLGGRTADVWGLRGLAVGALLVVACAGLVVVNLGAGLLELLHNYTTIAIGQRMVNDLRGALYAHLQRLSLAFHSRQKVGDLMYRITADSFAVQTMIMNGVLPILSAIVLLAGMLAVLLPLDARLTLVSLTIVPLLFVLIAVFNQRIATIATEVRERESHVYSLVQWAMSSVKLVQAFTKEEDEYRRFMGASRASLGATLRLYSWQTLYSAAVNGLIAAGTALVVYVGARSVMGGALTIGELVVFIAYLAQLYAPVNQITQSWGLIAGARVGARRCFEILDTEPDLADGTRLFPAARARGDVEWRGVSFRYRPELPVLRGVDLHVTPGQRIAIVGATGAGKSTLVSLVPRFFDPSAGAVLVDGIDVREYRLQALRRQIAMVLQPPLVFPISVRDNIAYGRPEASDAEIEEAARLARIHEHVMRLPEGYATILGDAATLSEGEKQRLTIARAILRDASILILDEPTSSLDVETEALVMEGLARLTRGRTTFVIAHRLSTVRSADLVVVLKDGLLVERGSFAELVRQGGVFADLYATQFGETVRAPG
ncbi:MAG TPA: ABC transporter ATP-binding protein [Stellaceae bacterium]|nr:ABC transporter ATP-binding protein [Stellaceae bacterium]